MKKQKVNGKVYIFLDEIQNVDRWEVFVNSYAQDIALDCELFITGSNSKLLSGELATFLSGRYIEFLVLPFNFKEYLELKKYDGDKPRFIEYLQGGGLPETFHLPAGEVKRQYVASLKNTIIMRDIIQRHKVRDVVLLEEIFKFLATNIGNVSSFASIIKYFKNYQKKTNYETVSSYVNFLLETFMFYEVERYNIRGKKVLGGNSKYYVNDLAFKNELFGFQPSDIGYLLENYVFLYLLGKNYKVNVGVFDKYKIDFIAQKKDRIIYIQVAYVLSEEKTVEREFGNLALIEDNYEKYVITMDDIQFSNYKGIKHVQAWRIDELDL